MIIDILKPEDAELFIDFMLGVTSETDFILPTYNEVNTSVDAQSEMIKHNGVNKQVFVAKDNGKIVAFIGVTKNSLAKISHVANFAIAVLDEYKGKGLATELMKQAEEWLKSKSVTRIEMTVIKDNLPAIKLYEKLGYAKEGMRINSIKINDEYFDEVYMSKVL